MEDLSSVFRKTVQKVHNLCSQFLLQIASGAEKVRYHSMFPYSQIQNGPEGIIAYVNRRSVDCEKPKTYVDEEIRFLVRIHFCANL